MESKNYGLPFLRAPGYIVPVSATEVIQEFRVLPKGERAKVIDWIFSDETALDEIFDSFDRLPRKTKLTEEEILALPRARSLRQ